MLFFDVSLQDRQPSYYQNCTEIERPKDTFLRGFKLQAVEALLRLGNALFGVGMAQGVIVSPDAWEATESWHLPSIVVDSAW